MMAVYSEGESVGGILGFRDPPGISLVFVRTYPLRLGSKK
jgi:hypothetical protein